MGAIIREILLIDLITQLIQGLIRLAVIVGAVVVALAVVGGRCFGSICIPDLVNLSALLGEARQVTGQAPIGEPECPQFADAFPQLLPDTWTLQRVQAIDIDGDPEKECLAVYQYNAGNGAFGGPLGAVIYDPQPDRDPANFGAETPIPYRPAVYVPYHLLPRKDGRGFLSERAADWSQMIQVYNADGKEGYELVFLGYSAYGFPTYLSIFQWVDRQTGYRLMTHPGADAIVSGPLWGDAGIEVEREILTDEEGNEIRGRITKVAVKTRPSQPFWYFRSQLCYVKIYGWDEASTALEYQNDYYLTFCFGRPNNVQTRQNEYRFWYPEEALLAWYETGEVREISLPPAPAGPTLQATVTLRQGSRQRWLVTWNLDERTDGRVGNMTSWHLQQVGEPYDP